MLLFTYYHSHFLTANLDFTFSFFSPWIFGVTPFFTACLFLIRYHYFFVLFTPKQAIGHKPALGPLFTCYRKEKEMLGLNFKHKTYIFYSCTNFYTMNISQQANTTQVSSLLTFWTVCYKLLLHFLV